MPLGTEVGPGQTSIVLDGDPSPPREGANGWGRSDIDARISRKRWEIRRRTQWRTYRKPPLGCPLAPLDLTSDDLERSKVKITIFDANYLENGGRYDIGLNGWPIGKHRAVDWRRHIYPPMTLKGQNVHRNIYALHYVIKSYKFYLLHRWRHSIVAARGLAADIINN